MWTSIKAALLNWFWVNNVLLNLLPVLLVAAGAAAILRSRHQPLWAEAYRRLRHNAVAIAALVVIGLYGTVALLDSFGWMNDRNATRVSVVDRLFKRPAEKTFSAPLAHWTTGEPKPQRLAG